MNRRGTRTHIKKIVGGVFCLALLGGIVGCGSESEPLVLPTYEGEVPFGSPVVSSNETLNKELGADEIFEFGEGVGEKIEDDVFPQEARPKLPEGQKYADDFDEISLEMINEGWVPSGRGGVPLLPPVNVGRGSVSVPTNSVYSKEEYNNAFIKARSLAAKNLISTNIWRNNPETGMGERRSGFMFLDASELGGYMTLETQGKWYKDTENLGEKNSKSVEALKIFETLVSLPPEINGSWSTPAVSPFMEFEASVPSVLREGPQYPGSTMPSIVVGFTVTGYAGFFDETNKLQVYKVSRDVEYTMVKEPTGVGGSADWFLWKWNNGPTVLEKLKSDEFEKVGFNGTYLGDNNSNLRESETPISCDANGANCKILSR
jgi:hypothetical protein